MNILLGGFKKNQISFLRKKFKKVQFFLINKKKINNNSINAIIAISSYSFDSFYKNFEKKKFPNLSWIHFARAGIDDYFKDKSTFKDYLITNLKSIQGPQVAEHAVALLLNITRNINMIQKFGINVKFKKKPIELKNKKILIVGYGGVGRCLAKRLKGFEVEISTISNSKKTISRLIKKSYISHEYKKAFRNQDVIIFTVPLTSKSKKILNSQTIKLVKRGAYIINVSRGGVICTKTLYKYLKNNYLGGAGIDVIEEEPIKKSHKLFKLKNFVYTPHIAGISDNFSDRNFNLITTNIYRFIKKQKMINLIYLKDGY